MIIRIRIRMDTLGSIFGGTSTGQLQSKVPYIPGKNIWNKIEKSIKTGQKINGLISTFVCFVTAIARF